MKAMRRAGLLGLILCLVFMPIKTWAYNDILGNRVDYAVGEWPRDIVAADLDQDGDYDLAVANFGAVMGVHRQIQVDV
jgi:hypothetical protein